NMDLMENAEVCTGIEGNACDIVYNITKNETLAVNAEWAISKPLAILVVVLLAALTRWILHRVIDRITSRASDGVMPGSFGLGKLGRSAEKRASSAQSIAAARHEQRAKAMGSLLKSISTGVIFAIAVVMVLSEVGVNIAPIIASAGIVGLAIGFGAQSLVKDFLSGIFMIFEDQYGVGDVIDAGEAIGTVEAVSLRVTRIRDINGTVWYVRNGEILRVGNMSQNWAQTVLDIQVAYSEDLHRVRQVLADVAHDMWEDEDYKGKIIEEPEVWGIQSLDADGVTIRVVLKTAPLQQWVVAREMRERIKARFDHEGIEIPFPQRVVWHRDAAEVERHGQASNGVPGERRTT
ncbi:MAG TPA: mechanosensitive ion channel family protein, partial [Nocardioidaceae bacterium]|nr:mechanosensitive ion channel family protein [Nocardioidaceae bacterium]